MQRSNQINLLAIETICRNVNHCMEMRHSFRTLHTNFISIFRVDYLFYLFFSISMPRSTNKIIYLEFIVFSFLVGCMFDGRRDERRIYMYVQPLVAGHPCSVCTIHVGKSSSGTFFYSKKEKKNYNNRLTQQNETNVRIQRSFLKRSLAWRWETLLIIILEKILNFIPFFSNSFIKYWEKFS